MSTNLPSAPESEPADSRAATPDATQAELVEVETRLRTNRNDPCLCGSGRKYKKCCLRNDEALARAALLARQSEISARVQPVAPPPPPTPLPPALPTPAIGPEELRDQRPIADKTLPPELETQLDVIWTQFESLDKPTTEDMNRLLGALLALPPDATYWSDLMDRFAKLGHADLSAAFHRIAASVPHVAGNDMSYFYWWAAEQFARRGDKQLLSEVAAGYCKFGLDGYAPDALTRVEEYLLTAQLDAETLALAEHFLPIHRLDGDLTSYGLLSHCELIYLLRIGEAVRLNSTGQNPEQLAADLRRGLEDDIAADSAEIAAAILCNSAPKSLWGPADFDLVRSQSPPQERQDLLRLFGNFVRVAQEAWRLDRAAPGSDLKCLMQLRESVLSWKHERQARFKKKTSNNLLDFLRPTGLEERILWASEDILTSYSARLRLQLRAHELLGAFALRHRLITLGEARVSQAELSRLHQALDASSLPAAPSSAEL